MVNKLIKGSKGTWGDEPMPGQPNLEMKKAKEMVNWILRFNSDLNYAFYVGAEGSFRTRVKPANAGVYILTASYQDHGLANMPGTSKMGQHKVVLVNK